MKKPFIILSLLIGLCFISCLDEHKDPLDLSIKVGNIYGRDGAIYPVDYFVEQGLSPAGIVTSVGGPDDGYRVLIVGLEDLGSASYLNTVLEDVSDVSTDVTAFDGKDNTAALLLAALESDSTAVIYPEAAEMCSNYKPHDVGAWHLPSVAEFRTVSANYATIARSLKAVGGETLGTCYMTSTVDGKTTSLEQLYNYCIELPGGNITSTVKTEPHQVRPFLILK